MTAAATKAAAQSRTPDTHARHITAKQIPPECAQCDELYSLGNGVSRAASVATYDRKPADPVYRPLQVYTLDPASLKRERATAVLRVPYEPLKPGPRGCVFEVDSGDPNGRLDLEDPRILIAQGLSPSPSDRRFHSQMVYAVCSSVYAAFRAALGRRIAWACGHYDENGIARLKIRPHAREEGANAAYDRSVGEIRFGYFEAPAGPPKGRNVPGGPVYTCLSHHIIVHELTHALIDGMRSRFLVPTGPDVLGFHEGFADLIAILQHFSYKEVLESEIRKSHNKLTNAELLTGIAQAFGLSLGKSGVLRSAVDSNGKQNIYGVGLEPHDMGVVLSSAVFDAFRLIYQRKTERYVGLATGGSGELPEGEVPEILVASLRKKQAISPVSFCDVRAGARLLTACGHHSR